MVFTTTLNTFTFSPDIVERPPLAKALELSRGAHGAAKEDCITECVDGKKCHSMESPIAAVRVDGSKRSLLSRPTVTLWILPETAVDGGVDEEVLSEMGVSPYCARVRGRRYRVRRGSGEGMLM